MADSSTNSASNSQGPVSIFQAPANASHQFASGPKLAIKLDDKNFLLWNKQIEGVVKMHKLHRLLVNPVIPQKYASEADRRADKVSDDFENWLVQDQTLFTWILSTLSESVLPRVLTCEHSWQLWEKLQQHYFSHLKAKARQLRHELKNTKKGSKSISEFLTAVHALADTLTSIGESISDSYLCDVILDGLPEEYSPFVMMIFGRSGSPSLSEIESLLLVQESQLDKFRQELAISNATVNVAQVQSRSNQGSGARGNASNSYQARGRGRQGQGRARARGNGARGGRDSGTRPTCQLCGRYGHSVLDCWYRFDESFVPPPTVAIATASTPAPVSDSPSDASPSVNLAEALPLDATGTSILYPSPNPADYED